VPLLSLHTAIRGDPPHRFPPPAHRRAWPPHMIFERGPDQNTQCFPPFWFFVDQRVNVQVKPAIMAKLVLTPSPALSFYWSYVFLTVHRHPFWLFLVPPLPHSAGDNLRNGMPPYLYPRIFFLPDVICMFSSFDFLSPSIKFSGPLRLYYEPGPPAKKLI